MSTAADPPTAPVAAGSLIAGFALARGTGIRAAGCVPLVLGDGWCAREWARRRGATTASTLIAIYAGGFVGSHLLARRIGAWPAVLAVAGTSGVAAWALADR